MVAGAPRDQPVQRVRGRPSLAGRHGLATPESLQDALAQLDGAPDIAIDGGILRTVPSTLVNCNITPPVIERVGVISEEAIWKILA